MHSYKNVFPDFDHDVVIPDGFEDTSWGNDICPSFFNLALQISLYVDYANPERREWPELKQFSLHRTDEVGGRLDGGEDLVNTDDWQEVLKKLAELSAAPEAARRRDVIKQAKAAGFEHGAEWVKSDFTYFWNGKIDDREVKIGSPDLSTAFPGVGEKWAMTVVLVEAGHQVGIEVMDFAAAVEAAKVAIAQIESVTALKN